MLQNVMWTKQYSELRTASRPQYSRQDPCGKRRTAHRYLHFVGKRKVIVAVLTGTAGPRSRCWDEAAVGERCCDPVIRGLVCAASAYAATSCSIPAEDEKERKNSHGAFPPNRNRLHSSSQNHALLRSS